MRSHFPKNYHHFGLCIWFLPRVLGSRFHFPKNYHRFGLVETGNLTLLGHVRKGKRPRVRPKKKNPASAGFQGSGVSPALGYLIRDTSIPNSRKADTMNVCAFLTASGNDS